VPHCGRPIAAAKEEKPKGKSGRGCLITTLLLGGLLILAAILGGKEVSRF
jgi:hypothetical protein